MKYKWTVLTVTLVGTLMAGLDDRFLIIGLPTISSELRANAEQAIWFTQAYMLASTIGLLLIGRFADMLGRVKIYNLGFVMFTVGSALSSVSFSPLQLIVSRFVQGTGSAMLTANSLAIITDATPISELGTSIGISQIAYRSGSVMGLTFAGAIITLIDWRALFYINIPIGIFGTLWAQRRLREVSTTDVRQKMDWPGFATFVGGLTLILIAITFLNSGTIGTVQNLCLFVAGGLCLTSFVYIETRVKSPLLDLRLFRIREFAGANLALTMNALSWSGMIILVSLFLQLALRFSPLQAGLGVLPLEATFITVGPISGGLSDKYGSRTLSTIGLMINSLGIFSLSTFSLSTSYVSIALALAALGAGNGLFNSPNSRSVMTSIPANRRGIAAGFRSTMFNVGQTASYSIVILLLVLGIPYPALTSLLQGGGSQVALEVARGQFISGFKIACFVLAFVNAFAIVPSYLRGHRRDGVDVL